MNNQPSPALPPEMLCRTCGNAMIYGSKSQIHCFCKVTHRELFEGLGARGTYIVLTCTDKIATDTPQEQKVQ